MYNRISKKIPYNKAIAALSVIAALAGLLTVFVGILLLPVAVAALAALMLFEKKAAKPVSISVSLAVLAIDVAVGIMIKSYAPIAAVAIILMAVLIAYLYNKRASKAETVFYVTAAAVISILLSLAFAAFEATGVYSLGSLRDYYGQLYAALKESVIAQLTAFTVTTTNGAVEPLFSAETAGVLFDSIINMLISYGAILAFIGAGLSLKLFSAIVTRCAEDSMHVRSWRFVPPSIIAYFYVALIFLAFFAGGGSDAFSVVVTNLQTIFMFVFAYLGFGHLFRILSAKRRPMVALVFMIIGILLLSSLALTLLSVFGVIFTVTFNKANKVQSGK